MLLASSSPRVFVPAGQSGAAFRPQRSQLDRAIALTVFGLLFAANVYLFAPRVAGIPIRSLLSVATLGVFALLYAEEALLVLRKNLLLLGLAAGLALLGIFVSAVNGAPPLEIARMVSEVHVQAAVVLMAAAILAQVCGARACMIAIVAVIAVSAAVAALQMIGVHAAWDLRLSLGPLARDEETASFVIDRRPTGLSYSPIQLATQLCLAFAAFTAVRDKERQRTIGDNGADPAVLIALSVLFAASVVVATRSPILGGFVFLGAYVALRRGSGLMLLLMLGGLLIYLAWPLLMSLIESSAPRVARVDDNSVAARSVFAYYGIQLFLDNPLGYGLTFQPSQLWGGYWADLYMMRGAQGSQVHALHNYVLSMINIYGVGLLLFVPLVARLLVRAGSTLIFFIPYAVHILFHNSGPFYNDILIWFVVAAVSAASVSAPTEGRQLLRRAHRGFRVAPGSRQLARRQVR